MTYVIVPLSDEHRSWATQVWSEAWGSPLVASRGRLHDLRPLPGFVAVGQSGPAGEATYRIESGECELMSINSLMPGAGLGTRLVEAVRAAAEAAGCWRLWLITTNDNLEALRFFQRRGFRLVAVYPNALAASRRLKPQIPLAGKGGLPLRDEIELELRLAAGRPRVLRLHHVQLTIPPGHEDEARAFYTRFLGLPEIPKPPALAGRGGFWVQAGDRQIHLGTEAGVDRWATRAHLAYEVADLAGWRARLAAAGYQPAESIPIPGHDRLEFRDPFGNRVELIEPLADGQP